MRFRSVSFSLSHPYPSSMRWGPNPVISSATSRKPAPGAVFWFGPNRHAHSPIGIVFPKLVEVVFPDLQVVVLDEVLTELVVVEVVLFELLVVLELVVSNGFDILFAEDVELFVPVALLALHVHSS